jgi:thiol-disulfide isomerase/thioredoxin
MFRIVFLLACNGICVCLCAAAERALTIGSLAPSFSPDKVIRGSEQSGLERGRKYVIEFSGTTCIPCIQMIPLMEEAKQKYEDYTFVTVFTEPEDVVRKFLNGFGAKMTSHVVCDFKGAMYQRWVVDTGRLGIPSIVVVNEDSKILWMGSPEKLPAVLETIAKDGAISKEQLLLVQLEQHAAARTRATEQRQNKAEQERRRIIVELTNKGKHAEAVQALDKAMVTYHDLPKMVDEFRSYKFNELAYVPGSRAAAFLLAFDIAADNFTNGDPDDAASSLLQHYRDAIPENKNSDLVYLALDLLKESEVPGTKSDDQLLKRRNHFSSLADANHMLGRRQQASEALQESIKSADMLVRMRRANGEDATGAANILTQLREKMTAYGEHPVVEKEMRKPADP